MAFVVDGDDHGQLEAVGHGIDAELPARSVVEQLLDQRLTLLGGMGKVANQGVEPGFVGAARELENRGHVSFTRARIIRFQRTTGRVIGNGMRYVKASWAGEPSGVSRRVTPGDCRNAAAATPQPGGLRRSARQARCQPRLI